MLKVHFNSLNSALSGLCKVFDKRNDYPDIVIKRNPRNLNTYEIHPCIMVFEDPLKRYLTSVYRRNNIVAQLAEVVWVLGGRNDMDFLCYYLPNAIIFSDDGKVWRSGYGKRLRNWIGYDRFSPYTDYNEDGINKIVNVDQIKYVIDCLSKDKDSRQAVISIWDPASEISTFNCGGTKDNPCCNFIHFMINDKEQLDCEVVVRSNDLIFGFTHINILEWTILQEIIASILKVDVGILYYYTSSLHVYDNMLKRVSLIAGEQIYDIYNDVRQWKISFNYLNELDFELRLLFGKENYIRNNNLNYKDIIKNGKDFNSDFLRDVYFILCLYNKKVKNKTFNIKEMIDLIYAINCPVLQTLILEYLLRDIDNIDYYNILPITDNAKEWIKKSNEYYKELHKEYKI